MLGASLGSPRTESFMKRPGSVNWQAGMLIEAGHFTDETEHLRDLISQNTRVLLRSYGVCANPGDPSPLDLGVAVRGLECHVELRRFRGVFPGGLWIDFEATAEDIASARCTIEAQG